jgi:sec-independent protein translocase protein TatA
MPNLGGWEVFAILAVVVLLFGAKRLPDLARGSGRALRIFKTEVKGLHDDDDKDQPTPLEASEADKKPEQG